MQSQLRSSDIGKLLDIVQVHQKSSLLGKGGGSNSPSAITKGSPASNNYLLNLLNQGVNTVRGDIGSAGKTLLKAALNQKITDLPNSPTIGEVGGNDLVAGFQNPAGQGVDISKVSPAYTLGMMLGMPNPANPESDASSVDQGISDITNGGKTAEEIQAAKSANLPRIIRGTDISQIATPKIAGESLGKGGFPQEGSDTSMSLPPRGANLPPEGEGAMVKAKGRTYAPGNPSDDQTENIKRNLQYTTDGIATPKQKAQVNATLNGYGIKGSMDNQLQGIEDTKSQLSQAAQKQVEQDGGMTKTSDLLSDMVHDVSYNGSNHTIPLAQVPAQARTYLNNVYVRATGGDPTKITGDTMPDQIPDTTVQKMKSLMNQDASKTFGKDPSTWTTSQQVARYARNSFDTLLDNKHPEASVLNNDMSDLYNAQESIMKGANKENTAAQSAILNPTQKSSPLSSVAKYAFGSPLRTLETAGVLGAGYGAIYTYNEAHSQNQNYHFSSGNVSVPGLSQITTNTGNTLQDDAANYTKQIAAINTAESSIAKQVALGLPNAKAQYQQLENQRNTLETQYATVKPIYDQYQKTSQQIVGLNQAQQLVTNANPQWFQAFGPLGGQLTGLRAGIVPGYAAFKQKLDDLHAEYGIDTSAILGAASPQAADAAINQAVNSQLTNLKTLVTSSGGQWPSNSQQQQTQNQPQAPTFAPNLTGNAALDAILSPTPTQSQPITTPASTDFQQQLAQPFQPVNTAGIF